MNPKIIESFIEEYTQFRQEFAKKAKEKLKEVVNEFWAANPGVNVIVWTQYAPYFNDGSPCTFSVNDPTFSNCTNSDEYKSLMWGEYGGYDETIWAISSWDLGRVYKKNGNIVGNIVGVNAESIKSFSKFITSEAMENPLRDSLGEDNLIIVTRDGILSQDFTDQHE